jgi:DNA processing protein
VTAAEERAAMVALLRTGRRPWADYAELVEDRGSALAVLEEELEPTDAQGSLFPEASEGPEDPEPLLQRAAADLDSWDAAGMRLITVLEPDYPPNLRAVHDRPPMVFTAGRLAPEDARSVAVIGARQATPKGRRRAAAIAEHLATTGYTVVSGLAAGIDTAAHTAALGANGRTVAVIGTGLARSYPPENRQLQRRIASECAVISQFWPEAPPTRRSFPM